MMWFQTMSYFYIILPVICGLGTTTKNHSVPSPPKHDPVPAITMAAALGNISEVERLLKHGADVNERDWIGQVALHMAAKFGRADVGELLLKNGADPNAKNEDYAETPFHDAAKYATKKLFKPMLDRGANINAVAGNSGYQGGTPLHYCVQQSNSIEAARILLENGANVSALNLIGQTPLHPAVQNGNFKMAELLLRHGADVDAKDGNGNTPLNWMASAYQPQIPLMALLISRSADVNTRNNKGESPLDHAAQRRNFPVVLYLLKNGAKWNGKMSAVKFWPLITNTKDDFPFVSELAFATAFGQTKVVNALLKKYAPIKRGYVDGRDWLNQTALHTAAMFGRLKAARCLLSWKADVNARDANQYTPLHYAAKLGDHKMLQLLIDAKADLEAEAPDTYGTALNLASFFAGAMPIAAKVLLKAGASVKTSDGTGSRYTPLHWATNGQYLRIMEMLLDHDADIQAKTFKGETPFSWLFSSVCCYPQLPVVQFLLDHGADINAKDNNNCTALCWAKRFNKRPEVLQYLIDRGAIESN